MNRREFLKQSLLGLTGLVALPFVKLNREKSNKDWTFHLGKYDPTTEILYLNGKPAMIVLEGREYSDR